jgi:signal transduction histidine kinase
MNLLAAFASVKARLLALMMVIIVPIGILMVTLAAANYRSALASIEAGESRVADDYAIRVRLWLRGVLRTVNATLAVTSVDRPDCAMQLDAILRTSQAYRALVVGGKDGALCLARQGLAASDADLKAVLEGQRGKRRMTSWTPVPVGQFRYDVVKLNDATLFAIHLSDQSASDVRADATLLVAPELLDQVFDLGTLPPSIIVGLVSGRSDVMATHGPQRPSGWLPSSWPDDVSQARWTAVSSGGVTNTFTARLVAEPDLVLVVSSDGWPMRAATLQFATLIGAPLAMLALLYLAYSMFIQRNVVEGIAGIRDAAIAESSGRRGVMAPIDPAMPEDIRSVAEAYNRMLISAEEREASLTASLNANRSLMRELHHRVKNSLQVIQSYLALTRREHPTKGGEVLRDAEAKVQVLAVAYRFALTDAGMQKVQLAPFVRELLTTMSDAARRSDQTISATIATHAAIAVDRAIPLGLAIVDEAYLRLKDQGCTLVTVSLTDGATGDVELCIDADGARPAARQNRRTLDGLRMQLGAEPMDVAGARTVCWRIALD